MSGETSPANPRRRLLALVLWAVVAGAAIGLVGALFRGALLLLDSWRTELLESTAETPSIRWLVPIAGAAIAVGMARLLVRTTPQAAGSGVQHVEANLRGEEGFPPWRIVPVKFVGGLLSMGAGLVLGWEGPTVQMGATIGSEGARMGRLGDEDRRTLSAAIAGAGLGVAFNAPFAGAVFTFEGLTRAIRTRLVIATLVGSASALSVAYLISGSQPLLPVPTVPAPGYAEVVPFAILGLVLGLLGAAYNRSILWSMDAFARLPKIPPEAKAAAVGALIGFIGILDPVLIGSGGLLIQEVQLGRFALLALIGILLARWILGPLSYATGAPGGLFAPLLVVGAVLGAIGYAAWTAVFPGAEYSLIAFTIVGMSTFFTAIVRSPITGILLVMEMTATTSLAVPMLLAAGIAMVATTLIKAPPIYDSLRQRSAR